MAIIEVTGVSKTYHDEASGRSVRTLDNVSIGADENDFLILLGPSGCGKSTLLNIIAGLTPYDDDGGSVMVQGKRVTGPNPEVDGLYVPGSGALSLAHGLEECRIRA